MEEILNIKTNKKKVTLIISFIIVFASGISTLYFSGAMDPLLAAFTGHEGCGGCHGPNATYAGGDHVTTWEGDTSRCLFNP